MTTTPRAEVNVPITQPASKPAFGTVFTPNMVSAQYANEHWSEFVIRPLQNYSLHPASLVLHYSQTIFEGMKAYRHADNRIALFRPFLNAHRLNLSASRMAIPPIDESAFVVALQQFVDLEREHIPARPGALYLRPAIFASESAIGVRTSKQYELMIIAMPVEAYFAKSKDSANVFELLVTDSVVRASPGGTGSVKAGANYAITLQIIDQAKKLGCGQVLFLNSGGDRLIEEAGGMNVFLARGKQLITPPLSGTILSGVTRDSILKLADSLELLPSEEPVSLDKLIEELERGSITEIFLCGTAAAIVSVNSLRLEDGRSIRVGDPACTPVADRLSDQLLGIQYGVYPDSRAWLIFVP
jgi:branched-chain amino acid aminotransferase